MKFNSSNLFFGMYIDVKLNKTQREGVKFMFIMDKDVVENNQRGYRIFKNLQTHPLEIYPPWKNQGHQSRKWLENTPIRIISIFRGRGKINE